MKSFTALSCEKVLLNVKHLTLKETVIFWLYRNFSRKNNRKAYIKNEREKLCLFWLKQKWKKKTLFSMPVKKKQKTKFVDALLPKISPNFSVGSQTISGAPRCSSSLNPVAGFKSKISLGITACSLKKSFGIVWLTCCWVRSSFQIMFSI